jgi:hypothetical protein
MSAFPADEVRSKRGMVDPVESMTGCLSPSSKEEARRKNDEALAAAQRAMLAAHNDVKADNQISLIRKISDTKVNVARRTSGTQSPATVNDPNNGDTVSTRTSTEEPVRRLSGTSLINAIRGNSNTNISGERRQSGTSIIDAVRGNSNTNITGVKKNSATSLITALRGNSGTNIEAPKKLSNTSLQSQLLGFNKWF